MRAGVEIGIPMTLGAIGFPLALSKVLQKTSPAVARMTAELPVKSSWNAISVPTPPPPEGHIANPSVYDLDTDTVYHKGDFPVKITARHEVNGAAKFYNDSDYQITATCRVWFTDPDGNKRAEYSSTETIPAGGATDNIITKNIVLDKYGTWQLHARMG